MSYAMGSGMPDGSISLQFRYHQLAIEELKKIIPAQDRRWDSLTKSWIVDGSQINNLKEWSRRIGYHFELIDPYNHLANRNAAPVTQEFIVEYIGSPKERDDGTYTATGRVGGQWILIFPQDVIMHWFGVTPTVEERHNIAVAMTHYAVLAIKPNATEAEIKKAYRTAAKRWHPDVNKDADATEMMQKVQQAYAVLGDETTRKKYDLGLQLAGPQTSKKKKKDDYENVWRPPVRCGLIRVNCTQKAGRYVVHEIVNWDNIVQSGLTMVSYWDAALNDVVIQWV